MCATNWKKKKTNNKIKEIILFMNKWAEEHAKARFNHSELSKHPSMKFLNNFQEEIF